MTATSEQARKELMEALALLQALRPETGTHNGLVFEEAFILAREVASEAAKRYVAAVRGQGD